MTFKPIYMGILGCMCGCGTFAADPEIYFSFDRSMRADFGGTAASKLEIAGASDERGINGKIVSGSDNTADAMLSNGISGKALLIGNSKNCKDKQIIEYTPAVPFSSKEGSVSFWVKPNDWEPGKDKNFHIFFSAFCKGDRILIYKYKEHDNLVFIFGNLSSGETMSSINGNISKWQKDSWHHVCAVWKEKNIELYLDGEFAAEAPRKDKAGDFTRFLLGEYWNGNPGSSLLDELKIFSKPLSAEEVKEEFLRNASAATASSAPITIQLGSLPVKVDGNIEPQEYAMSITAMNDSMNTSVKYSAYQSTCFFSWDEKYLYTAMKTPAVNGVKKTHDKHDGNIWEDDAVELFLTGLDGKKDVYQFVFNAGNGLYDAKNRNPEWQCDGAFAKSNVADGVWSFESAIPWRSLGFAPADLKSFRMNIARDFPQTNTWTCLAPGDYFAAPSYAKIILNRDAPQVALAPFGNLSAGEIDSKLTIRSRVADTIQTQMSVKANVFPFNFKKNVSVTADGTIEEAIKGKTPEAGNFEIRIFSGKFGDIYKNLLTYQSVLPVRLKCIYTDIPEQNLVMEVENTRLNAEKKQLEVAFEDVTTGKIIYEETKTIPQDELKPKVKFSIRNLANTQYVLHYTFLSAANKVIQKDAEGYAKYGKIRPWTDTRYGLADVVPVPWTPIEVADDSFACWGRQLKLGGAGILRSILSQNIELLARPVELLINGKPLAFNSKIETKSVGYVVYKLTPADSSVKLEVFVKAEFDGLLNFTVKLQPGVAETVKNLTFALPLDRKYVTGFDDCDNIVSKFDFLNAGNGSFYVNPVARPYFWCGGDDVGIMGGSATRRGWYLKEKKRGMSVTYTPGEVELRLTLIDSPLKLTAERTMTFYLQPTPVKPQNKVLRNLRIHDNMICWGDYVTKYFEHKRPGLYSMNHINYCRDQQENHGKRVFYYNASKGVSPVTPEWNYFGKEWHCNPPKLDEYICDNRIPDRAKRNFYLSTFGCLNSKDFYEYKLDSIGGFLAEPKFKVKDLYFDLTWPRPCSNETHGCLWTDEFGYEHHDSDLIPLRNLLKRIYIQMKQKNSDAIFRGHVISTRLPSDVFFDSIWVGELYDRHIVNNVSYCNVLTPHLMRVAYASRNAEMEMAFIPQFDRALMLFAPEKHAKLDPKEPTLDKAICHFLGYMLVHDLGSTPTPKNARMQEFFDAKDLIAGRGGDYTFYPYWESEKAPVKPSFFGHYCMISTFAANNKASIVILNDSDKMEKFKLNVDCAKLGLPQTCIGSDLISKSQVKMTGGKISIELAPRSLQIIVLK